MNPSLASLSDSDLLRRWADHRSADAFAILADRYAGFVSAVATRALGSDRSSSDDVTQAVFVLLAQKAGQLERARTLGPWLHRVTCYAASNARRTATRRRRHERAAAMTKPEDVMQEAADPTLGPTLDAAINRLNGRDRQLILARYLLDRDEGELAEVLGISRPTLQRRLSRAIDRLRSQLQSGTLPAAAMPALLGKLSPPPASPELIERINQTASGLPPADAVALVVRMTQRRLSMETLMTVGKVSALSLGGMGLLLVGILAVRSPAEDTSPPPATAPSTAPAEGQVPATTAADVADMARRMVGTWRVTAGWKDGIAVDEAMISKTSITISATRFDITGPGGQREGSTYTLAPNAHGVAIDIRDDARPDRVIPGIITIEDGELRLAFDDKSRVRPTGFMPEVESPKAMDLKRVEP